MPLLLDEFTPYPETPAERARRLFPQPSTSRAVPRSELPAWVQRKLQEQEEPAAPTTGLLGPEADPRPRAERLRELIERPLRGTAPGIASTYRPPTREVSAPGSYDADPYFDDTVRQDELTSAFRRPSAYQAQRAEERLFDAGLERDVAASVGSESAYERARRLLKVDPYGFDGHFDEQVAKDERAARSPLAPSAYAAWREDERIWRDGFDQEVAGSVGSESADERARRILGADSRSQEPPVTIGIDPLALARWSWDLGIGGAERGLDVARAADDRARDAFEASLDFGLDRSNDVLEQAEPLDTGLVNPAVGAAIAAWTDCPDAREIPPIRPRDPVVTIHENCGNAAAFEITGGRPFTFGPHVFVPGPLTPG